MAKNPNHAVAKSGRIYGATVYTDPSGVGHAWRKIHGGEIPANIREEIVCEILDGGRTECADYVASNGLHYRWA